MPITAIYGSVSTFSIKLLLRNIVNLSRQIVGNFIFCGRSLMASKVL